MDIAGLFIYIAIQGITPGPSNFMAFYTSATYGMKGAMGYLTGTVTGFGVKMLLCGLLNFVLAAYVPQVMPILKWIGAAYLLYLAFHIVQAGWEERHAAASKLANQPAAASATVDSAADAPAEPIQEPDNMADSVSAMSQKGISATFTGGILLQVLNIKSWLMCLSVFSVYIMPYTMRIGVMLLWTLITLCVMITCTATWSFFGNAIKRVYVKYRMAFDIVMALLLVYCAVTAVQ